MDELQLLVPIYYLMVHRFLNPHLPGPQAPVPATRQNVHLDKSKSMPVTPHAEGKFDLTSFDEANHSTE